jgi:hypothetical protein
MASNLKGQCPRCRAMDGLVWMHRAREHRPTRRLRMRFWCRTCQHKWWTVQPELVARWKFRPRIFTSTISFTLEPRMKEIYRAPVQPPLF